MLLREKSRRRTKLSTNHPRSRDSLLRRDSEERSSIREIDFPLSRQRKKPKLSMINFFHKSSRKEKLFMPRKKVKVLLLKKRKLQFKLLPPRRKLQQPNLKRRKLLPRLKLLLRVLLLPRRLNPRLLRKLNQKETLLKKERVENERSESSLKMNVKITRDLFAELLINFHSNL